MLDAQTISSFIGVEHGVPIPSDWRCIGSEANLLDCEYFTNSSCFHPSGRYSIATVRCLGEYIIENCTTGHIRLVDSNGPNINQGRVEYCIDGLWGTVGSHEFDARDARVVCRSLNYQRPSIQIFESTYFGQGSGPVVFDYISCNGNEADLNNCSYSTTNYVSHTDDVGVMCLEENTDSNCTNGAIRLVNGTVPNEGRVEICVNRVWGTICEPLPYYKENARVICKQLGFSSIGATYYGFSKFGDGNLTHHLWNVHCHGLEDTVLSCSSDYSFQCFHGNTAGVKCFSKFILRVNMFFLW
jgi:deleted-in-malignant-brain-tumors protein 1